MIERLQYISQGETPTEHINHIELACKHGIKWVQLRLKQVSQHVYYNTAQKAKQICDAYHVQLIINDAHSVAEQVNATGVHLGKNDECPAIVRNKLGKQFIIGGTANTIEDCQELIQKQVDYIGLGPFRFTTTKKNLSPIIGTNGYEKIISSLKNSIPIIAIGGIEENDIEEIMKTGVFGIAMSSTITKDFSKIPTLIKIIEKYAQ